VALDDDEWRLLRSLRELPESPLRRRLYALVRDLVQFVSNPGCPEAQADGVPCASVDTDCERCQRVFRVLESLRTRVRGA
jgi:predicted DCC family thiol-disulfide oxidoreductase YuxK